MELKEHYYFTNITTHDRRKNFEWGLTHWLISDKGETMDGEDLKKSLTLLTDLKAIPNNSKLYFVTGCVTPRYKVRDYGESKNISITIKANTSDLPFVKLS